MDKVTIDRPNKELLYGALALTDNAVPMKVKTSKPEQAIIRQAAKVCGITINMFVRQCASRVAQQIMEEELTNGVGRQTKGSNRKGSRASESPRRNHRSSRKRQDDNHADDTSGTE
jgi:hypothetical protein